MSDKNNYQPITRFKAFSDTYHDRLHALLFHIEEIEEKFTLITNLIDKSKEILRLGKERLIYVGADTQKFILEQSMHNSERQLIPKEEKDKLKPHWDYLKNHEIKPDMEQVETFKLLSRFRSGELKLDDVKCVPLQEYFKNINNPFQEHEQAILQLYFKIERYYYISIPVVTFGSIDGVVHIIFSDKNLDFFSVSKNVKRIVKLCTNIYEATLLDWDVAYENALGKSDIEYERLPAKFHKDVSPIIKELNLETYYRISMPYYKTRIEIIKAIPTKLHDQHRLNAIISILVDSFSHNISTHTMTALSWWLRERFEYVMAKYKGEEAQDATERSRYRKVAERYDKVELNNPLVQFSQRFPILSISNEMSILFRFLSEKATFWNAITRTTNFTGQSFNLFDIFWDNFIANSLYLGTIASSENIKKIKIYFTIFKKEERTGEGELHVKKYVEQNEKDIYLNGLFATINFQDFYKYRTIDDIDFSEDNPSVFIEHGDLYQSFKQKLSNMKAFFPGGVVGKHALLTIIENEIRNIKHYKGEQLRGIQKEGLSLNISVHPVFIHPEDPYNKNRTWADCELYKVGVWIKHPNQIDIKTIEYRMGKLYEKIITDDTYRPKFGGTYQDKICAAMLINNSFTSVSWDKGPIAKRYAPWIKSALSLEVEQREEIINDFEISGRKFKRFKDRMKDLYHKFINYVKGETDVRVHYKKYFHVWRTKAINYSSPKQDYDWENKLRFKFSVVEKDDKEEGLKLKGEGLIRVIPSGKKYSTESEVYKDWLRIWQKSEEATAVEFREGNSPIARIIYKDGEIQFFNAQNIKKKDRDKDNYLEYKKMKDKVILTVEHGGNFSLRPEICNYRSYGKLRQELLVGKSLARLETPSLELLYEFYEVLSTKICVFDDRIANRLDEKKRKAFYGAKLKCDIFTENEVDWKRQQGMGFLNYHILVIHLSFIENMLDSKNKRYTEANILKFVEEQIFSSAIPNEIPPNFIIVVTTGRARSEWWDKIKSTEHIRYITFRPIESLLAAVEDGLQIQDDMEVKYNLIKVLLNS